ncbi:hypothetical protein ACFO5R_18920 [Halosolutus amylolyticus]|uniref:Uncharacterized protein n=1 Tax=Halosolutus amylolyticus TaxID=2932267 RepID=A0ABD5PTX4_9EURY|nr:hypothetical protein [Halosolutus amylolyticus]
MRVVDILVVSVFGVWFGLTVINSTNRGSTVLARILGPMNTLVPKWNFFSPHPGQYDYHLFYRDRRVDDSVTDWKQIELFDRSGRKTQCIWNPEIYRTKLIFDIVVNLGTNVKNENIDAIRLEGTERECGDGGLQTIELGSNELSVYYLTLLNYVTERPHSEIDTETQFMVMQHSRAMDRHEPHFVSRFHNL